MSTDNGEEKRGPLAKASSQFLSDSLAAAAPGCINLFTQLIVALFIIACLFIVVAAALIAVVVAIFAYFGIWPGVLALAVSAAIICFLFWGSSLSRPGDNVG